MTNESFLQYYDLENFLFGNVSKRYAERATLYAFDFFCIVIWKANRAKSKVAHRLLNHGSGFPDLEAAVAALIGEIAAAKDVHERLRVLIDDWRFRLPMASAILTVLYPEEFTVYDVRVCEELHDFKDAQDKTNFAALWERYEAYMAAVNAAVPQCDRLRDKDRFLWGKSFAKQLRLDITSQFKYARPEEEEQQAMHPAGLD
jgi:hypothetical protein